MKRWGHIIFVLLMLFSIHTVFAEMEKLTEQDMAGVRARTGLIGRMVSFSEAFAETAGNSGKQSPDNAVSFNLAYVQDLREMEDNVRDFDEVFNRMETRPLENGWTYFAFDYKTDKEIKTIGEQLSYEDVFSRPVEAGLGLFGMGGFKVERSRKTRVRGSGRIKITYRP